MKKIKNFLRSLPLTEKNKSIVYFFSYASMPLFYFGWVTDKYGLLTLFADAMVVASISCIFAYCAASKSSFYKKVSWSKLVVQNYIGTFIGMSLCFGLAVIYEKTVGFVGGFILVGFILWFLLERKDYKKYKKIFFESTHRYTHDELMQWVKENPGTPCNPWGYGDGNI